jgi:hypothetical protein
MIFYRILGNDIPPRHSPTQTLTNLAFILGNEPVLPGCERRFLLNRIVDAQIKMQLIALIDEAGLRWHDIPFVPDEFRRLETPYEKALYLTNQNAARNRCIELGLADGDTVLPFDGQSFFTAQGWSAMAAAMIADGAGKYFTVPMFRLSDNRLALASWGRPGFEDADHTRTEPQLIVRRGCDIRFNPYLTYGQANKVELLMRLGVAGPWDAWTGQPFDAIRANLARLRSRSYGQVREAGFVLRLESGNPQADQDRSFRARARIAGLSEFVARIEAELGR